MNDFLHTYDSRGERTLALSQSAIVLFILFLHIGARIGKDLSTVNLYVICALSALILSSAARAHLATRKQLPERRLNALNIFDVTIFLLLIWCYQFAYDHPATGVLKAPSVTLLFVLVALRALRFHPIPLIVTGTAAVIGWLAMLLAALSMSGPQGITNDYAAYLTSFQILIRAEIEKLFGLAALTIFLAVATYRARLSLMQLDDILEHMPQGVAMFDKTNQLVICNRLYSELYGLSRHQVKPGLTAERLVSMRQQQGIYKSEESAEDFLDAWLADFESASTRTQELNDGRTLSVRRRRKPDGGLITTTVDISDRKQLEARLEHLAYHDALTDLLNRAGFNRHLSALMDSNDDEPFALIIADLNNFKALNDQYGHSSGDLALKSAADLFQKLADPQDKVCRIGGDEFAILTKQKSAECRSHQDLIDKLNNCNLSIAAGGEQVEVKFSLGAAFYPDHARDAGELLKHADLAMYKAKRAKRHRVQVFRSAMADEFDQRAIVRQEFYRATTTNEIVPYYHPLVNLETGKVEGLEALARWQHKDRGVLSPPDFSFIFDDRDLKARLAKRMVDCITADIQHWRTLQVDYQSVGLNLEVTDLEDASLLPYIRSKLEQKNIAARDLAIEITENSKLDLSDAVLIEQLRGIRAAGMYIALDDFGTGYSSLSHVKDLPLTALKLDKSFVQNMSNTNNDYSIARCLLDLAKSLGVKSVAEGVEYPEQVAMLRSLNCDMGQGFLFTRPVPASAVPQLIASLNAKAAFACNSRLSA